MDMGSVYSAVANTGTGGRSADRLPLAWSLDNRRLTAHTPRLSVNRGRPEAGLIPEKYLGAFFPGRFDTSRYVSLIMLFRNSLLACRLACPLQSKNRRTIGERSPDIMRSMRPPTTTPVSLCANASAIPPRFDANPARKTR
jgi:hypothetical protein